MQYLTQMSKIFEDFFDELEKDDMTVQDEDISTVDYPNNITMEMYLTTRDLMDYTPEYIENAMRRFNTVIRSSLFISKFKLSFILYRGTFSNKIEKRYENLDDVTVRKNFIEGLMSFKSGVNVKVSIDYTKNNVDFGVFFTNLFDILLHGSYVFLIYNHELEKLCVSKFKLFIDDVRHEYNINNMKEYHQTFLSFINIYNELYGETPITERQIIKFNKKMKCPNIYGALLSIMYASDSSYENKFDIKDFKLPSATGTYSRERYIYSGAISIDHVELTDYLTELYFDNKFEANILKVLKKHYFTNMIIVDSDDVKKIKNKHVLFRGYP